MGSATEFEIVDLTTDYVASFEAKAGASWPAVRDAARLARDTRTKIAAQLKPLSHENTSVVVFGSLARDEFTSESDVDWTLLVDGMADPEHIDVIHDIRDSLDRLGIPGPGSEETFGDIANSHELLHKIGGSDDTNKNTTQRLLLLLESRARFLERGAWSVARLERPVLEGAPPSSSCLS